MGQNRAKTDVSRSETWLFHLTVIDVSSYIECEERVLSDELLEKLD